MLVTYVIKGQVLSRAIHLAVHPASANDFGAKGRLVWFAITTVLLIVGWVLVNAVPFFGTFAFPFARLCSSMGKIVCARTHILSIRTHACRTRMRAHAHAPR